MTAFTFEAKPDVAVNQLAADIARIRDGTAIFVAVATLHIRDLADEIPWVPMLDAFVAQHGYAGLGEHWIELPRRSARKVLINVLLEELAYPEETMSETDATELAERFLNLFETGSRYFTNGTCSGANAIYTLSGEQVLGWRSISTKTFDNGIIAVHPHRIGILWAEDDVAEEYASHSSA